ARFPVFKSKHGKQSSYHPNGKVLSDAIQLPKIPTIRANIHREIVGKVSSITITRTAALRDPHKSALINQHHILVGFGEMIKNCA
ncbi:hypothetical protein KVP97_23390, partial [Escherichia coli]|nr:hypothetical protein [Escherichia coli]